MRQDDHTKRMAEFQRQFDAGANQAMLYALAECVLSSPELPIPEWVKKAFEQAVYKVMTAQVASWDDVFGRPLPKGKQLAATQRRLKLREQVWQRCWWRIYRGAKIDQGLFEAVARELRVGERQVRELYYELKGAGRRRPLTADDVMKMRAFFISRPLAPKI
jgi:hypothetical protein